MGAVDEAVEPAVALVNEAVNVTVSELDVPAVKVERRVAVRATEVLELLRLDDDDREALGVPWMNSVSSWAISFLVSFATAVGSRGYPYVPRYTAHGTLR